MDTMMCDLRCKRIQSDEIWTFVAKKDKYVRVEDSHAISFVDTSADEVRWQTFGMISGLVLMVVHACHEEGEEEVIRLISARKATSGERRIYEAHQETG